jgi:hypothetical protein
MIRFIKEQFPRFALSLTLVLTFAAVPRVATALGPVSASIAPAATEISVPRGLVEIDPVDATRVPFLCYSLCFHTCDFWLAIYTDGSPKNNAYLPDFECIHFTCNSGCDWGIAPTTVIANAIDAVKRDDMVEIAEILRRESGAHFNAARQSIQFEGCAKNSVVANIPLLAKHVAVLDKLERGWDRRVALSR